MHTEKVVGFETISNGGYDSIKVVGFETIADEHDSLVTKKRYIMKASRSN